MKRTTKIHFERSGGFTGLTKAVDIDVDLLPETERQALISHISNAGFFTLPTEIVDASATTGADRYNYRITIESNNHKHSVKCTDGSAPASLVPLLAWLNGASRREPRMPATPP